jgi:hypothetical protein
MAAGIRQRHGRGCSGKGRCTCPSRAEVYSKRDGKKIRKSFTTREASVAWLDGAREGVIRTRSGDPFKPGTLRAYEKSMRLRVLPELGDVRLTEIARTDLQDIVDALLAEDVGASTIAGTMLPVRAIYRRAMSRGEVAIKPDDGP